jgi:hypothetical protein
MQGIAARIDTHTSIILPTRGLKRRYHIMDDDELEAAHDIEMQEHDDWLEGVAEEEAAYDLAEQEGMGIEADIAEEEAPKPPKKRKPKVVEKVAGELLPPNYRIADLPLDKQSKSEIAQATRTLKTQEHLDRVRAAYNISHWALVGPDKVEVTIDQVCHASVPYQIRNAIMYHVPPKGKHPAKRPSWPYRYMVNWSNEKQKPEYHTGGVEFTPDDVVAVKAYYDWLRNRSHFARFFVGPTDIDTLFNYGMILDMSAPSQIVHFLCVAWRMPGEYLDLVVQWHILASRGVDPHIAFGMAQQVTGFQEGSEGVSPGSSPGHNCLARSSYDQMARLATGILYRLDLGGARAHYDTGCCGSFNPYDGRSTWFDLLPDDLCTIKMVPGIFNPARLVERKAVDPSHFASVWSKGIIHIYTEVAKVIDQNKGWK